MENLPLGVTAALIGLIGGIVLGLAGRLGNFCTLGALEHAVFGSDQKRLRMWGIVLGTAIIGTWGLAGSGLVALDRTFYHAIAWNPLASIVGGLVFGYGMALAGNCGYGALVRFGGGDLRSLVVVVVLAISGYVAMSGPLAPLRVALFPQPEATAPQGIVSSVQMLVLLPPLAIATAIGLGFIAWALAHAPLRAAPGQIAWAVAAGAAVVFCLAGTTWLDEASLGAVGVEGPSFTAPLGRTLLYLMTSTAGGITFSVGCVLGVGVGAFIGSLLRGRFRWEACEDPRELGRQMGGAALMGVGGVVAMGCSIGQGVTGFATLAWSGPVTLAAIAVGAVVGLRVLIGGFQQG
ncbi:MAG: YeeE/YedE family protein [Gemmobacter sp.]